MCHNFHLQYKVLWGDVPQESGWIFVTQLSDLSSTVRSLIWSVNYSPISDLVCQLQSDLLRCGLSPAVRSLIWSVNYSPIFSDVDCHLQSKSSVI